MSKHLNANTYKPSQNEAFIFDTNIWIYLYGPQNDPNSVHIKAYSGLELRIIQSKSVVYISHPIISEFINRSIYLHLGTLSDWNALRILTPKQLRKVAQYREAREFAVVAIKKILSLNHVRLLETNLSYAQYDKVLNQFLGEAEIDFNDLIICLQATESEFQVVTHDHDFNSIVTVLTANTRFL